MTPLARLSITAAVIIVLFVGHGSASADPSFPYGDRTTAQIANVLHGTHRGGWLATTLDDGGYHGRRHAEIVKIPAGHGKRWVGIIHVPAGNAGKARHALTGVWFAELGTRFVVPMVTKYDTRGDAGTNYRTASRWATRKPGDRWAAVAP